MTRCGINSRLLVAGLMGDDSMHVLLAGAAANGICLLAAPWDDSWLTPRGQATLHR
jgi:hypothetical protein